MSVINMNLITGGGDKTKVATLTVSGTVTYRVNVYNCATRYVVNGLDFRPYYIVGYTPGYGYRHFAIVCDWESGTIVHSHSGSDEYYDLHKENSTKWQAAVREDGFTVKIYGESIYSDSDLLIYILGK